MPEFMGNDGADFRGGYLADRNFFKNPRVI